MENVHNVQEFTYTFLPLLVRALFNGIVSELNMLSVYWVLI
jgi:hypothetical protein